MSTIPLVQKSYFKFRADLLGENGQRCHIVGNSLAKDVIEIEAFIQHLAETMSMNIDGTMISRNRMNGNWVHILRPSGVIHASFVSGPVEVLTKATLEVPPLGGTAEEAAMVTPIKKSTPKASMLPPPAAKAPDKDNVNFYTTYIGRTFRGSDLDEFATYLKSNGAI